MKHRKLAIQTGSNCPYCKSKAIESTSHSVELDLNRALNNMVCADCDKEWTETYILTEIDAIEREGEE